MYYYYFINKTFIIGNNKFNNTVKMYNNDHNNIDKLMTCPGSNSGRWCNYVCCRENLYHSKAVPDELSWADGFKDVLPTTLCLTATCDSSPEWRMQWRILIQASEADITKTNNYYY